MKDNDLKKGRRKNIIVKFFLLISTMALMIWGSTKLVYVGYVIIDTQLDLFSIKKDIKLCIKSIDVYQDEIKEKEKSMPKVSKIDKKLVKDNQKKIEEKQKEKMQIIKSRDDIVSFAAKDGESVLTFSLGIIIIALIIIIWFVFFYHFHFKFVIKAEMFILRYVFIVAANVFMYLSNIFSFIYTKLQY